MYTGAVPTIDPCVGISILNTVCSTAGSQCRFSCMCIVICEYFTLLASGYNSHITVKDRLDVTKLELWQNGKMEL